MSSSANALAFAGRRISRDRLVTTLIFALLAHGLVLFGVGFAALAPLHKRTPLVAVTLVSNVSDTPPKHARYNGQANARGPGNTRRTAATMPAETGINPFPNPAGELADALAADLPGLTLTQPAASLPRQARGQALLVTTTARTQLVASGERGLPGDERPLLLLRLSAPRASGGVLSDSPVELPQTLVGEHPEKNARTADTRAYAFAPYLEAWRERVEAIGNAQVGRLIPATIASGHLTLGISLNADGTIRYVDIEQPSRHPELDAAALEMIRLAAPFPPLPQSPAGLQDRPTAYLDFVYRVVFIRGQGTSGSVGLGGPSRGRPDK